MIVVRSMDVLWPHFEPLWQDLQTISPGILLIGGYGLFLKHNWLLDQFSKPEESIATVVSPSRWQEGPRVTKDFDLLPGLDLIASEANQLALDAALKKHGFEVVPKNARWQHRKRVGNKDITIDFHAPTPGAERSDLRAGNRRVKPRRSMGDVGIHGRENPEAFGTEIAPFIFIHRDVRIGIPHPVAMVLMKLVAMGDRFREVDSAKDESARREARDQARKHAEDVFRAVAMMTREERSSDQTVLDAVRSSPGFLSATRNFTEYCDNEADTLPENLKGFRVSIALELQGDSIHGCQHHHRHDVPHINDPGGENSRESRIESRGRRRRREAS
jgi:hypothetical protein